MEIFLLSVRAFKFVSTIKAFIDIKYLFNFLKLTADTECYSCDPKRSPNYCLLIDDDSSIDTCKSGFDRCYTIIDEIDGQVHRGCVGDNRFPDENTLQKCSDPDRCEICEDNHCNGRAISDICIKCGNSGTSPDCDGDLSTDMGICSLKDMKQSDGCFLKVADGHTYTRGCMRDLNTDELKQCRKQSGNCQSCIFPNCNQKDDFTTMCYECNGRNDTNCVETVESMTQVNCEGLSKTCVTGIDADGFIRRGCYSYDQLEINFPYGFDVCPGSLCNNRIHPVDWLSCYQCEGKSECEDLMNLHPKKCNNLRDQCYAYLDEGTSMFIDL